MWSGSSASWTAKVFCVWSRLRRYAALPAERQALLREAIVALALARIAIACLPFRRIAGWLGTCGAEGPAVAAENEIQIAKQVGWAVRSMARNVPWDGRCFVQATAAMGMLRRRGLEGTISFGASSASAAEFQAHAWLRLGPYMVTGGGEHLRFKTFTTFARMQP